MDYILILELSINIFESYLMIEFITNFNTSKYRGLKHQTLFIAAVALLFVDVTLSNYLDIPIEIPSYIAIVISTTYSMIALRGRTIVKIASCILFNVTLILVNGSSILIIGMIFNISVDMMMTSFGVYRFILLISSKLILFYISRIILKLKVVNERKVPSSSWVLITVIPLLTMFIMVTITETAMYNDNMRSTFYLLLSIVGLIITNVVFYYIFMKSIKDYGILTENQLLKQHIIMQEKHSIEIKNLYKEIQTIRHDIKNQLISIRTFVEDNNNDRALDYISDIIKEIDLTKKLIFTKNDMFNAIIDNKFSKANSKGIKTSFMIYHELEKQIDDADINILFGNLLDNAIEACGNLVGEKEIQLLIEKKRDYILIQVKNTIEKSVLQDNPKLLTSKVDKFNHGMGIRSIRKIVRKYDGIIDFSESRNMFICDILILDDNS
jgi:two-component system, LytTR family, sensor histidine kinase AgrC